jgi:hypothetical protein
VEAPPPSPTSRSDSGADAGAMTPAQRQALRFAGVVFAYVLLAVGGLWIVWSVRGLLPPFFVAFIMAITLVPPVDRLEARGWPRGLATGVVYLGLFAAVGGLMFVLVPVVSGEIGQIVLDLRAKFPTTPGGNTLAKRWPGKSASWAARTRCRRFCSRPCWSKPKTRRPCSRAGWNRSARFCSAWSRT